MRDGYGCLCPKPIVSGRVRSIPSSVSPGSARRESERLRRCVGRCAELLHSWVHRPACPNYAENRRGVVQEPLLKRLRDTKRSTKQPERLLRLSKRQFMKHGNLIYGMLISQSLN